MVEGGQSVIRIPAAATTVQMKIPVRKVVLLQEQSPGDILTLTSAVGDLKRTYPHWQIDVKSPAPAIWDNNPHLTPLDVAAPDVETYKITYDDINISGWSGIHFSDAFRHDIEKKLNLDELLDGDDEPLTVDAECQGQIVQGLVPEVIRQKCASHGIVLTDNAVVSHMGVPVRWTIYDSSTQSRLEIRHENNRLTVYNANPEKVKKWGVTKITKTGIKPELFISDDERSWWHQIHCEFFWDGPYWVINAGRKPDNELKQYHRWQEVAEIFNERFAGRIKLVQMGHPDHIHPPLAGAFDLIGKTDLRQLIRLIHWAHGTIGPLSFQFVISAAYEQPAICVAAGKEGVKWHLYPHIRHICTNGALECCRWDGCWLGGARGKCQNLVDNVPKCFRLIEPHMIVDALEMYYTGGRLEMPTDEQMATWTKDVFILEGTPERQRAFHKKLGHHRLVMASTAKDACGVLSKEQFDIVSLGGRLSEGDVDPQVAEVNSGATVAKYLAQLQTDSHVIVHGNELEEFNRIKQFLPSAEHRPGYWK